MWSQIELTFRQIIPHDAMIIMDSCAAGAAVVESAWLQLEQDGPYTDELQFRRNSDKMVGMIAAGDWQSENDGWERAP